MDKPKYFFEVKNPVSLDIDMVHFVQLKEGGLLDDLDDPASKIHIPGTYTLKIHGLDKTSSHWHTNRGITWETFMNNAKEFNYPATAEMFFQMPDEIFLNIFKKKYCAMFEKFTPSPVINYYLSMWVWGSGGGGAKSLLDRVQKEYGLLTNFLQSQGELKTLEMLIQARIDFYTRLTIQKPNMEKFLGGWTNGALSYYWNFIKYIKS